MLLDSEGHNTQYNVGENVNFAMFLCLLLQPVLSEVFHTKWISCILN